MPELRLDVVFAPGELATADLAGRVAVVIDVLRASTTIVEALSGGARAIFPVPSLEEAIRLANTLGRGEVLLCGERRSLPIEGFDLGNSPAEFTPERVAGKTLVMSTTNGTAVMFGAQSAPRVLIAALTNLGAVAAELVRSGAEPVIVCSGREGRFGLDDAVCAGRLVERLLEAEGPAYVLNDGAQAAVALSRAEPDVRAMFARTGAGRLIADAGFGGDLDDCARVDTHTAVPVLHDRQITLAPLPAPEVP